MHQVTRQSFKRATAFAALAVCACAVIKTNDASAEELTPEFAQFVRAITQNSSVGADVDGSRAVSTISALQPQQINRQRVKRSDLTPEFQRFVDKITGGSTANTAQVGSAAQQVSQPMAPLTRRPVDQSQLTPEFKTFVTNITAGNRSGGASTDLKDSGIPQPTEWSQAIGGPPVTSLVDETIVPSVPSSDSALSHDHSILTPSLIDADDEILSDRGGWSEHLQHIPPATGSRTNNDADGICLLDEYQALVGSDNFVSERALVREDPLHAMPVWWDQPLRNPLGLGKRSLQVGVPMLIQGALAHSPHIQVAAANPQIRQTFLVEESAAFDWQGFVETRYDDSNDPIGNSLTTGDNANRFNQQEWYARGGGRRRLRGGGDFEAAQRIGTFTNNSRFLVPADQGNSRLELTFNQPLLNGRGQAVTESLIVLAQIESGAAGDEFAEDLQSHLIRVTETYWELHRARATYLQRQRLLGGAQEIMGSLAARAEVDALDRQVLRAQSAVATRQSEIARARAEIRNAEAQLRLLVGDPALVQARDAEFMPLDAPFTGELPISMSDAMTTALSNRPDISRSIRELRSSAVKADVARNDLLPQLDLQIAAYVAGLAGQNKVERALGDQFADGRPGFGIGLEYAMPVGNRAARARHERRKWQQLEAANKFRVTVQEGMTEVEIAVREVETSHLEMTARYQAMQTAAKETDYLIDRWRTLPDMEDSAVLLLENLLDSQSRQADEEAAFVQAQVNYAIATVRLRQAMGTLLQMHNTY